MKTLTSESKIKIPTKSIVILVLASIAFNVLSTFFLGSLVGYAAIAACIGCLACLIYSTNSFYPILTIIPSVAIAIIFTPILAAVTVSLVAAIASLPIAMIPTKIKNRTSALAQAIVLMSFAGSAIFALIIYTNTNTLSLKAFTDLYIPYIEQIKNTVVQILTENEFDSETISLAIEYIDVFVKTTVLHIPSIIALIMMLIAYTASAFFKITMKAVKLTDDLKQVKWPIAPSRAASVIYFLSYVAMFLLGDENVISIAASNIMIILTPVFVVVSSRVLNEWIKKRESKGLKILCWIMAIFSLIFNLSMFLTLFATAGAIINFALRKKELNL